MEKAKPVSKKAVEKKAIEVAVLDQATQDTLAAIKLNDEKFRRRVNFILIVLLLLALAGLGYQNYLAHRNQNHIDCIVKLLATPSTHGQTRQITDLATCSIKVK